MINSLLKKNVTEGTLNVHLPGGKERRYGRGAPEVDWILHRRGTLRKIALHPEYQLGETYLRGEWDVGRGGLMGLLEILLRNFPERQHEGRFLQLLTAAQRRTQHWNPIRRSYRNVAHHYDLDAHLFRRFLDQDLNYSCAYYSSPDMELEDAQRAKQEHIRRKLRLEPGQRVLDIGCGWGSLALYLAEQEDVTVTGLTLSQEQLQVAEARAHERGLSDRVRFLLQDYREHTGQYDRIVSVGMFEHVGAPHYRTFFDTVAHLLTDDGITLLHTIGRLGCQGSTNPWIRRYIFPGGYVPALSEISSAVEWANLCTTDVEVLRLHYALTLADWQRRFQARREEIADRMGETFCRMWEFYLALCEAGFRWRGLGVFQVQLAHHPLAAPLTRDYLYREETVPAVVAARSGGAGGARAYS